MPASISRPPLLCPCLPPAVRSKYCATPVLVIVDVRPDVEGLPVTSYQTVETVVTGAATASAGNGAASPTAAASAGDVASLRTFAHVPSEVGAYEAEEVGVEHLLRDINDPSVSSMAGEARHKLAGLRGLVSRLGEISAYLGAVLEGKLPLNHEIMYSVQARIGGCGAVHRFAGFCCRPGALRVAHEPPSFTSPLPLPQSVLTALPNMNVESLSHALTETTNDQHLALYIASLTRSVLALHDLVANKQSFRDVEEAQLAGGDKKEAEDAKKGEGKEDKKEAGAKKDAAAKK